MPGPLAEVVVSRDGCFDRKASTRNFCLLLPTVLTPSLLQVSFLKETGTNIYRTLAFLYNFYCKLGPVQSAIWPHGTTRSGTPKAQEGAEEGGGGNRWPGQDKRFSELVLLLLWSFVWPCRQRRRACPTGDCATAWWDIHPCLLQGSQLTSVKLSMVFSGF